MNHLTAPRGYSRVLACALCQQRKVKCDRQIPCATCTKAGVGASCVPSTPAPVRRRRRPAQDLRRRLARCEELLLQHANQPPESPPLPSQQFEGQLLEAQPETPGSGSASPRPSYARPAHIVVKDENRTRLMDGHLMASLYEELQNMRDIVETEAVTLDGRDDSDADLLLSGVDPSINVQDLQPDPVHVFRLWQLYLDRVNPLTKIIHVPTLQPIVLEATTNIEAIPVHQQALLFSIYLMAIMSTSADECVQMFGISKEEAMRRYTLGAKASLIKFNFLKNENMEILQALLLFQFSLHGRCDRYALWIISGIILRIAHKMGYHRDGEALGLTPFETEMRRRLWWQVMSRDSTQGAVSGIMSPSMLPVGWDCKEPANLNDADLFPSSTESPRPREGPTEMGFCLIFHRAHKLMAEILADRQAMRGVEAAILGQTPDGKGTPGEIQWTLARFRDLAISIDAELKSLESRYIDTKAGNAHVAVHGLRFMMLGSLLPSLTPIEEQPEWGVEILTPEDNVFKMLVISHEHACDAYGLLKSLRFEWWLDPHFQTECFAALVAQLCNRPTGSLSERAWKVLTRTFEQRPDPLKILTQEHKSYAQYILKGWDARERALVESGQPVDRPAFIERLQMAVSTAERPEELLPTPASIEIESNATSSQLDDLGALLEGYDPSEVMTWSSWGDFSVAADDQS
ncbi:fungal-specific transcription factor domain-containing protein [Immersiella caudata]|uniref:Fungal-specific transcription factor domain-containing protein n=1 Tax=Immersiella caudata TaxID=314043 RepID=A0AA39WR63_9PEZI|nr:fungal-specific transcription factor domain-containing protein [Immersiella caudata]